MIDYLNPHHVYIDAQAAPDLSMNVKRGDTTATIVPKRSTLHNPARTDADKGVEIMDNRINQRYGSDAVPTPAADCPVCGGMYKGESCEVCGYDGELIRENVGKDAINRYCTEMGERRRLNDGKRAITPIINLESTDRPTAETDRVLHGTRRSAWAGRCHRLAW